MHLGLFFKDKTGSAVSTFSFYTAIAIVTGVLSVNLLDSATRKFNKTPIAKLEQAILPENKLIGMGSLDSQKSSIPMFNNVDTTATGSISKPGDTSIMLDPCTGKTK